MSGSFDNATQFRVTDLMIDGENIIGMFFSLAIYEHVLSSVLSGNLIVVETGSNQFLAEFDIEGNEVIEFSITLPGDDSLSFKGFINKISTRNVTPEGVSTYSVEFTSGTVRENESKHMTKRYKSTNPKDIINDTIRVLNDGAEIPVKADKILGTGLHLNYVASRWHPIRNIQYVQKHGVPSRRGGTTSINTTELSNNGEGKGTGAFMFFETLKGYRFGSSVELLGGELGTKIIGKFKYQNASQALDMEVKRRCILDYQNIQNNDTQTQMRSGAFKSRLIAFDMDSGLYHEQEYESPMMTEKQRKLSKAPTRYMNRPMTNQRYNNGCEVRPPNSDDQTLKYLQQQTGSINNITDGICQYTLPIRTDINAGDRIDIDLFETSISETATLDKKYSGRWIVASVAHHFLLETMSAYTRVSCLRATNQTSDSSAQTVSLVD